MPLASNPSALFGFLSLVKRFNPLGQAHPPRALFYGN